ERFYLVSFRRGDAETRRRGDKTLSVSPRPRVPASVASGGFRLVLEMLEELLADHLRDEDLLQVVQRGQGKWDPGGGERGADRGQRQVPRLLTACEFGIPLVEHAAVVAEDHPVDIGVKENETHLTDTAEELICEHVNQAFLARL